MIFHNWICGYGCALCKTPWDLLHREWHHFYGFPLFSVYWCSCEIYTVFILVIRTCWEDLYDLMTHVLQGCFIQTGTINDWLNDNNLLMAKTEHQTCYWLTHWGLDKMEAISQTTCSIAFSWMKMFEFRLKFHWSLFLRVPLTII